MPNDTVRLDALEKKIDAIYVSVEKTRKYLLVTAVVTLALIVLPALGLVFAIPSFMSTYGSMMDELQI
ncbi:MAG: Uncharacterized protein G01um10148_743 [Parcubacteria group bacterium Gr01-1014_8]|nr:MAG: Uncharacterized protein G01um10148_743 [Parcubacteria group bacterium Gr01-1014_8]